MTTRESKSSSPALPARQFVNQCAMVAGLVVVGVFGMELFDRPLIAVVCAIAVTAVTLKKQSPPGLAALLDPAPQLVENKDVETRG